MLIALIAGVALANDVLPLDESSNSLIDVRGSRGLELTQNTDNAMFACPVDPRRLPQSVQTNHGILNHLPGTDIPFGSTFYQYDNVYLRDCFYYCSQYSQCEGLNWICRDNSPGTCVLFTAVNGRGPSNCANCVGYEIAQQCPLTPDKVPFSYQVPAGILTKLPGSWIPNGAVLADYQNTNLDQCLQFCARYGDCRGVQWQCRREGPGFCRLLSQVTWTGDGNCPDCIGYAIKAQCPLQGDSIPSRYQASSVSFYVWTLRAIKTQQTRFRCGTIGSID